MVTPRTGKPRGRPPITWRDDPDRYAVALIAALDALEATSVRQISLLPSGLALGRFASPGTPGEQEAAALERIAGATVETVIEKIFGSEESVATFAGRADSLREKYR